MNLQDKQNQWRDENQKVRILNHNQDPVYIEAESPREVAVKYISEIADIYEINAEQLKKLESHVETRPIDEKASFRLDIERKTTDTAVVSFVQTYFGLRVWEAALNVVVQENPSRVLSSNSTAYHQIDVKKPSADSIKRAESLTEADLEKILGLKSEATKRKLKINRKQLLVYKYDASKRTVKAKDERQQAFVQNYPTLPLPDVPDNIKDGNFYVVEEILFTMSLTGWGELNWQVFVEVETTAVLLLRALIACADGYVFKVMFSISTR
jgi:zinc metalloprotease ZmpB